MTKFPVSDASVLIAFDTIGHLELLRRLFGKVLIPTRVEKEVFANKVKPNWIEVERVSQSDLKWVVQSVGLRPDKGETEAIALTSRLKTVLLIDDLKGRKAAEKLNMPVMGSLRLLVEAKRHGFIEEVKPLLCTLERKGFYISEQLRQWVLREAGEV